VFSEAELKFIEGLRVAHLATADAEARPHVVPVCFVHLDGCVYVVIDEKPKQPLRLKRLRNIDENPQVTLVFDRYDEDWSRLAWVMAHGTAYVLDGGREHERALVELREKYTQYREMALDEQPMIKVTVDRVSSWGGLN
jgi:PPOX class probable F420-dependent enzyme